MLDKEVFEPRRADRAETERTRESGTVSSGLRYDYASELFSVRRKEFWPLFRCRSLLQKFIPTLCHETDGLIFQVAPLCHETDGLIFQVARIGDFGN